MAGACLPVIFIIWRIRLEEIKRAYEKKMYLCVNRPRHNFQTNALRFSDHILRTDSSDCLSDATISMGGLETNLTRGRHMVYHVILREGRTPSHEVVELCACYLLELGKMTRVFIGRLSMSARESDVERFLRGYGKVRDISLKRGYGFVVRGDGSSPLSLWSISFVAFCL